MSRSVLALTLDPSINYQLLPLEVTESIIIICYALLKGYLCSGSIQ